MKLIGLAGWSGAGKTTLIERVLPLLVARGLRVSTIKHAHHAFDIDQPGKDSYRHRQAGASEVLVASAQRFALIGEWRGAPEPPLGALVARLAPADLVLVEGYRHGAHAKVEIHRVANNKPWLYPDDSSIAGIVTDAEAPRHLPSAALGDSEAIATLLLACARPAS